MKTRIKRIFALLTKYSSLFRSICYKKRWFNFILAIFSYLFKQTTPIGLPFIIQIEPTNKCNLTCALCITGNGRLKRIKGDLSFQTFKKIIDDIQKNIIYLGLYNLGESLLNKDIYRMTEYAKKKKIYIRLSTSGFFHDKEIIKNLISCGIDELIISLDCASPQTYSRYKGKDGFKTVIDNTKSIINNRGSKLKPFIALQLLVMKETEREIEEFKVIVKHLGADRGIIKTLRINFPDSYSNREFLPTNKKYIRKAYLTNSDKTGCYRPWLSTVILWDGTVVPCCFDMEGDYNFGNLTNKTFKEIWHSEKYISFRKQIKKNNQIPLCKECSLKDISHDLTLFR